MSLKKPFVCNTRDTGGAIHEAPSWEGAKQWLGISTSYNLTLKKMRCPFRSLGMIGATVMPRTINPMICLGFEMIAHPHLKQKQLL